MSKKQSYISAIGNLIRTHNDGTIDNIPFCEVYDEEGQPIYHKGKKITYVEILDGENVVAWYERKERYKNPVKLCNFDNHTLEKIYGGLNTRRDGYHVEKVEERTREIAETCKKRMDELVNRAFRTGAFYWDDAFRSGYTIPRAILYAVCNTLKDECSNSDYEIINEGDIIYRFL